VDHNVVMGRLQLISISLGRFFMTGVQSTLLRRFRWIPARPQFARCVVC
jgi:hypothetical protein